MKTGIFIKIKKHENIRAKSRRLNRDGTILSFFLIKALTGLPGKVYFPLNLANFYFQLPADDG